MKPNNRLLSLDVLRGLTVAGMVLVNNGAGHEHFQPLTHCQWNGMTPCDLVFPFFLFMVGVSIPMSSKSDLGKVLWRSIKMFAIGVLLHVWDMWLGGHEDILANLRIWGVLERISLCYLAASVFHHYARKEGWSAKVLWGTVVSLLAVYTVILLLGNGYAQDDTNLACIIDRALFGEAHLYQKNAIDPEGLLGTLPSIAHTLIGIHVGLCLKRKGDTAPSLSDKLVSLFFMAGCISILGYLLSYGLPLNKRIWSPSYVLVTCGMATTLLCIFTVLIDQQKRQGWCRPLQWFGTNAIALYVASEMLAPVMWETGIAGTIYEGLLSAGCCAKVASLGYALSFDALMALLAWVLFKRKIFIKL